MTWRREAPAVLAPPPGPPRKQGRTAWLLAARGLRPTALWQRPAGVIPLGKKEEVDGSLRLIAWAPAHIATGSAAFGAPPVLLLGWEECAHFSSGRWIGGPEQDHHSHCTWMAVMPILKPLGLGLDCSLFPLCSIPSSFLQNAGGAPEQQPCMHLERGEVWKWAVARSPTTGTWPCCPHYASPSQTASHDTRNLGTSQPEPGALKTIGFPPPLPNRQLIQNS